MESRAGAEGFHRYTEPDPEMHDGTPQKPIYATIIWRISSAAVCDILLWRICQRNVWLSVTNMHTSLLQWSVVMSITSCLSGVSYEWLTVRRHNV